MPFELIYTSAPRGLKLGTSGFATVARTRSTPQNLVAALEALSVFRRLFSPKETPFPCETPAISQLLLNVAGTNYLVFSRVADAGLDYSGRANFIACHWAFETSPRIDAATRALNPVAFWNAERDFFLRNWDREPDFLDESDWSKARKASAPEVCRRWAAATGDAGWAGAFAATIFAEKRVLAIVEPGADVAGLLVEALALTPLESRRKATFSAPFFNAPIGTECRWRIVGAGTSEETSARTSARDAVVFDLTRNRDNSSPTAAASPEELTRTMKFDSKFEKIGERLIESARTGETVDFASIFGVASSKLPPVRRVEVPKTVAFRRSRNDEEANSAEFFQFGDDLSKLRSCVNDAERTNSSTAESARLEALYEEMLVENESRRPKKMKWSSILFGLAVVLAFLAVATAIAALFC